MNNKEGNPDNLGGLGQLLPAEVLEKLNQLFEILHQAEVNKQGSTVINIFERGSQYVERIDQQYFYGDGGSHSNPEGCGAETINDKGKLPKALAAEEAMVLWQKAKEAGWVNENYQPLLSRTQSALLADAMAERLGIREKWKTFEKLWNRKNMRSDYNLALSQQQTLDFQDDLKRMLDL